MMNFLQSNPDISQRMTESRLNDNAVGSSSHSVFTASTTHTLRSLCESLKLESILNSTRVYRMANKNTSTTTFKTKYSSFSQLSGRSLSEVSNISIIHLPVYALEINNGGLYRRSWRRVALDKIRFQGATDPGEIVDLAAAHPDVLRGLLDLWRQYTDETGVLPYPASAFELDPALFEAPMLARLRAHTEGKDVLF